MKKVLEIIAVVTVVLCLISAVAVLYRGRGSAAPAGPGGVDDVAPTTAIIESVP